MIQSVRSFLIFSLLQFFLISNNQAQLEEHTWFFGGGTPNTKAGIRFDFLNNQATPYNEIRYPLQLQENNIIISNPATGEEVFYSDGQTVIDASHNPMPNGTNLFGSPSAMYGTAVVFDPTGCDRYFLISVQSEDDASPRKIFYSAIDLNLAGNGLPNSPLGDIDPTVKNIDFTANGVNCTESIFALPKAGATKDSWLFFGDRNNRILYLYEITTNGFGLVSQFDLNQLFPNLPSSPLFSIKMDYFPLSDQNGRLVIAPGRNVNQATYPVGVFDFNIETGILDINSNIIIDINTFWTYGTAFSPDGSKLYLSDYIGKTLKQFDFNSNVLTVIGTSPHNGRSGGLKTAPDGKVYWANAFVINNPSTPIANLSVVNQPNLSGIACDLTFNDWIIEAIDNPRLVGALPSFGTFPIPPTVFAISADECDLGNGSATIETGGSQPPLSFQWDNGETMATAVSLTAGFHWVTITDGTGCEKILQVFIDAETSSPDVDIMGDTTICELGVTTTTLDSGSGFEFYEWSNGETTQMIEIDMPGIYGVTVTNSEGCSGESGVEVIKVMPTVQITGNSSFCEGEIDSVELNVDASFDSFLWSDGSMLSSLIINESGEFSITVTDSKGCVAMDTVSISSFTPPQIVSSQSSYEIEFGESQILNPTIIPNENITIEWTPSESLSCGDCPNPTAQPTEDQLYQLIVSNDLGCVDSVNIFISVIINQAVYVPNAFSPNNDGINDYFTIYSTSSVRQVKRFQIFDRWGELVFENQNFLSNDSSNGWSGSFNGRKMNPAVFVWLAEIEFQDGRTEILKGDVILLK